MIASRPVMKADIPAAIPVSMVRARAGLAAISAKMVLLAGTDSYNESASDEPVVNKSGMATMSPIDHFPNVVPGKILQGLFVILFSIHYQVKYQCEQDHGPNFDGEVEAFLGHPAQHFVSQQRYRWKANQGQADPRQDITDIVRA